MCNEFTLCENIYRSYDFLEYRMLVFAHGIMCYTITPFVDYALNTKSTNGKSLALSGLYRSLVRSFQFDTIPGYFEDISCHLHATCYRVGSQPNAFVSEGYLAL